MTNSSADVDLTPTIHARTAMCQVPNVTSFDRAGPGRFSICVPRKGVIYASHDRLDAKFCPTISNP